MQVKIFPLYNPKLSYQPLNNKDKTKQNESRTINELSSNYYSPVNFKGVDNTLLVNELENLHGIHCPTCNVVMLTEEECKNITEEANNIKTADEFVGFLEQCSDNIVPEYRNIVRHSRELLYQKPEMSLLDLQKKLSAGASTRLNKTLGKTIHEVEELNEKMGLSDNDKELIKIYIEEGTQLREKIKSTKFLKEYKNLLSKSLYKLENKHKNEINNYIYTKVKKAYDFKQLFTIDFNDNEGEMTSTARFMHSLLSKSVSKMTYIDPKLSYGKDSGFNEALGCKHCRDNNKNIFTAMKNSEEDIKSYTGNYIEDLGNAVLNGKMKYSGEYVFMVNGRLKALNKETNKRVLPKTLFQAKNMLYQQKRSELGFSLVDIEEMPCAGCGKKTLTHNQVTQIHDEIMLAKDVKELASLMNKYADDDLVRPRFKPIIKTFKKLLYDKKNINEDEIFQNLCEYTWKSLYTQIDSNISEAKKYLEEKQLSADDKKLIYHYIGGMKTKFNNCDKKEPFPYEIYNQLLKETLINLKTCEKDDILYSLKNSMRAKYVAQLGVYRGRDKDDIMNTKLRYAFFQIVKNSIATIDHVIARDNDGADNKNNLIVLCKDCNKEKSNSTFTYWLKHKNNAKENLQKFINKVMELIKNGKIEDYDDYPSEITEHINKAAGRKIIVHKPDNE